MPSPLEIIRQKKISDQGLPLVDPPFSPAEDVRDFHGVDLEPDRSAATCVARGPDRERGEILPADETSLSFAAVAATAPPGALAAPGALPAAAACPVCLCPLWWLDNVPPAAGRNHLHCGQCDPPRSMVFARRWLIALWLPSELVAIGDGGGEFGGGPSRVWQWREWRPRFDLAKKRAGKNKKASDVK